MYSSRADSEYPRQPSVRQVVGHGQYAIGIGHIGQVADLVIEVTRHLAPRQGLAEQLIHGVVGEQDVVALRSPPLNKVVVAVVGVAFDLTQGIGGAEQSVPAVVGKGGHLILGIGDGQEIAVAVVGIGRDTRVGIGHLSEPVLGIIGKRRDAGL